MDEHQRQLADVRALIIAEPEFLDSGTPGTTDGSDHGAHEDDPGTYGGAPGSLDRLCRAATRALAVWGVGLSVMTDARAHGVVASSDAASAQVEELQFVMGEGPCMDAVSTGRPVLAADLGDRIQGWPAYVPAAQNQGVRAVFAFPLQMGALCLGAMDVYNNHRGPLSPPALTQALAFAEIALFTILDGQAQAPSGEPAAVLYEGLGARAEIYQAQGMLVPQLGVGLGEAMLRLRAHAYAYDRTLLDVARDVLAGRLDLNSDDPPSKRERYE